VFELRKRGQDMGNRPWNERCTDRPRAPTADMEAPWLNWLMLSSSSSCNLKLSRLKSELWNGLSSRSFLLPHLARKA
jgi:hypothetical protein